MVEYDKFYPAIFLAFIFLFPFLLLLLLLLLLCGENGNHLSYMIKYTLINHIRVSQ